MFACLCVCIHAHIQTYKHLRVITCMSTSTSLQVCDYVGLRRGLRLYAANVDMHARMHVCTYARVYACIYIYVCMHLWKCLCVFINVLCVYSSFYDPN